MKLATKTLGIKLERENILKMRGYLVVVAELIGEENGKLEVVINEENEPFIFNKITKKLYVNLGIPIEYTVVIKEELEGFVDCGRVDLVFIEEKIEI